MKFDAESDQNGMNIPSMPFSGVGGCFTYGKEPACYRVKDAKPSAVSFSTTHQSRYSDVINLCVA